MGIEDLADNNVHAAPVVSELFQDMDILDKAISILGAVYSVALYVATLQFFRKQQPLEKNELP